MLTTFRGRKRKRFPFRGKVVLFSKKRGKASFLSHIKKGKEGRGKGKGERERIFLLFRAGGKERRDETIIHIGGRGRNSKKKANSPEATKRGRRRMQG